MKYNLIKLVFSLTAVLLINTLYAQSYEEARSAKKAEMNVFYYENEPYAYKDGKGNLVGIEIDIMNSFVSWLDTEKGIQLKLKFERFKEFDNFYQQVIGAPLNTIGLGSVTISELRSKEIKFSAPYLKNVAVLVTDGSVPTARTEESLRNEVLSLAPVTIKGSIHQSYLDAMYQEQKTTRDYVYVQDVMEIPQKIKESAKYYGYVDAISFWKYLKTNPDHYIKMHSFANQTNEVFGFIMPKTTDWDMVINEFFESGFGFTATKEYHSILEKHLSFEIINKVELD